MWTDRRQLRVDSRPSPLAHRPPTSPRPQEASSRRRYWAVTGVHTLHVIRLAARRTAPAPTARTLGRARRLLPPLTAPSLRPRRHDPRLRPHRPHPPLRHQPQQGGAVVRRRDGLHARARARVLGRRRAADAVQFVGHGAHRAVRGAGAAVPQRDRAVGGRARSSSPGASTWSTSSSGRSSRRITSSRGRCTSPIPDGNPWEITTYQHAVVATLLKPIGM